MSETTETTTEVVEPQTWRDYAGQLTAEQIERLGYVERQWHNIFPGAGEDRTGLVRMAAGHAADNAAQVRFAGIAAPADAIEAPGEWREYEGDVWSRFYDIARTELDGPAPAGAAQPSHGGDRRTRGRQQRAGGAAQLCGIHQRAVEPVTSLDTPIGGRCCALS